MLFFCSFFFLPFLWKILIYFFLTWCAIDGTWGHETVHSFLTVSVILWFVDFTFFLVEDTCQAGGLTTCVDSDLVLYFTLDQTWVLLPTLTVDSFPCTDSKLLENDLCSCVDLFLPQSWCSNPSSLPEASEWNYQKGVVYICYKSLSLLFHYLAMSFVPCVWRPELFRLIFNV